MLKQKVPGAYLSSQVIGWMFLIPGLLWGVPCLITGTFVGAAMGFCTFAVLFGTFMLVAGRSKQKTLK